MIVVTSNNIIFKNLKNCHLFLFCVFKAQDVAVVYVPIVPLRLGDIDITVHASTLIGKDQITRRLHVEVN